MSQTVNVDRKLVYSSGARMCVNAQNKDDAALERENREIRKIPMVEHIVEDFAEFLGKPFAEVSEEMLKADTAEYSNLDWVDRERAGKPFYENNEKILYGLLHFNLRKNVQEAKYKPLLDIEGLKVLDYGCGIGTLAFILAEQNNDVVGYDINARGIEFCNYLKKKYNRKGHFTTEEPDLSQFNVIVMVDLLEHIEDLENFIKKLGREMKSGATLYHNDGFDNHTIFMHFDESHKLNEWLREAGFTIINNLWAVKN